MTRWDGTLILTTPRLLLRTYREGDLPLFAALNADPAVMEHLGGEPLSRQHSDEIAEWAQQRYAQERIGLLAVDRREDGAFIGMCGLHHQQSYPDELEVAWRFAHAYWGHGYATEAASAWLDYGFDVLGAPRIISITDRPNVRSLAVMRRLGMVFDHEAAVEDDGETFEAVIHAITAEQWRRSRDRVGVDD
jgi:RimJ/RimL family protein N-acetyltransferase